MSSTQWHPATEARSRMRPGRVSPLLLLPVFIVIIAGSLIIAYKGVTTDNSSQARRSRQRLHFKCDRCGHEFALSPREFSDQAAKENITDQGMLGLANCPSCGQKHSCRQMMRCPKCEKYFVPVIPGPSPAATQPAVQSPRFVCPNCKAEFDWREFLDTGKRRQG